MIERLDSLVGEVGERFRRADKQQRRGAALVACLTAVKDAGLSGADVGAALDALRAGRSVLDEEREGLIERSAQFDDQYFQASEDDEAAVMNLFRKARAYSALAFALSPTGEFGEAIYEAVMAAEDLDLAVRAVEEALAAQTTKAHRL